MKASDNARRIDQELDSGNRDAAVWERALAEGGGDLEQARAIYIRQRFAMLDAEASHAAKPPVSELECLRVELRRQLALQRRPSLYSALGVPADASDDEIFLAIRRIGGSGLPVDPETRYAVEELGNPQSREAFDRRLMQQLRESVAKPPAPDLPRARADLYGRLPRMIAGVVLVLGVAYLGLNYTRAKAEREIRIREVELSEAAVRRAAELAERAAENQRLAIENSAAERERAQEANERARIEARMREDKQRMDSEYRQEQQLAQAEQRRRQAEESRLLAEARRRDAEAVRETRAIRQQLIQDAIARGNHNEAQRLRNLPY